MHGIDYGFRRVLEQFQFLRRFLHALAFEHEQRVDQIGIGERFGASEVLRKAFPDADWVDALFVLERQRVKKSPEELKLLKYASEAVIDSMQSVIAASKPGVTKSDVVETLRREETNRGLTFEYCLITAGTSFNRAPSEQKWEKGEIMSIDFGWQLSRLYRRRLPHGDPGRTRCRAQRFVG